MQAWEHERIGEGELPPRSDSDAKVGSGPLDGLPEQSDKEGARLVEPPETLRPEEATGIPRGETPALETTGQAERPERDEEEAAGLRPHEDSVGRPVHPANREEPPVNCPECAKRGAGLRCDRCLELVAYLGSAETPPQQWASPSGAGGSGASPAAGQGRRDDSLPPDAEALLDRLAEMVREGSPGEWQTRPRERLGLPLTMGAWISAWRSTMLCIGPLKSRKATCCG